MRYELGSCVIREKSVGWDGRDVLKESDVTDVMMEERPLALARGEWMTGIGQWIRERRLALGLTQTDLAKRAGLDQSTISAIEIGRTKWPSAEVRRPLARALGVTDLQLLVGAGEVDPQEAGVNLADADLKLAKVQALWSDLSEAQRESLVVFAEGAAASNRARVRND